MSEQGPYKFRMHLPSARFDAQNVDRLCARGTPDLEWRVIGRGLARVDGKLQDCVQIEYELKGKLLEQYLSGVGDIKIEFLPPLDTDTP